MERGFKHLDCWNYAPVDVVKGICHVRKRVVLADEGSCELFEKRPKCKHCTHYTPGEQAFLGICEASTSRPMTYPDLLGVTCEHFREER
jgi:hypothetical protein